MGKIYEPSLPKLMEAIATEARGMKGLDRRNFLKGGIAAVAGLASVQIIPKASASSNLPRTFRNGRAISGPASFPSLMVSRLSSRIFSAGLSPG